MPGRNRQRLSRTSSALPVSLKKYFILSQASKLNSKSETTGINNSFLLLPKGKYKRYPDGKVDNSHFKENGAKVIASLVVNDAKKQKLPVSKLFK
jgi:hypothetical protein